MNLKPSHFVLLLAVPVIFFNSCKKSTKNETGTPATKLKYLTQVIIVETGPPVLGGPVTTTNTYYTYDSKKRISTVKSFDKSLTTYSYQDDGKLFSTTVTNADGVLTGNTEYTYSGGKVASYTTKFYQNNQVKDQTTFTYVYSGDKATELHFDVYYNLFTYDSNGNITKTFYSGSIPYSSVYTFDDKKNRYINSPTPGNIESLSPNNRVTSTTEGLNVNILTTYTYVYDSDGYPVAGTATSDYANTSSYKYTYFYSTLD